MLESYLVILLKTDLPRAISTSAGWTIFSHVRHCGAFPKIFHDRRPEKHTT